MLETLKLEREAYIGKYIGDFDKPYNYKQKLAEFNQKIQSLENR